MPPKLPQPRMMRETSMPLRPRDGAPRRDATCRGVAGGRSGVVEQGQRVAGVAGGSLERGRRPGPSVRECCQRTRARSRRARCEAPARAAFRLGRPVPARPCRDGLCATSASTSSGGACSTRATPGRGTPRRRRASARACAGAAATEHGRRPRAARCTRTSSRASTARAATCPRRAGLPSVAGRPQPGRRRARGSAVPSSRAAVASQDSRIERLTAAETGRRRSFVESLRLSGASPPPRRRSDMALRLTEHIPAVRKRQARSSTLRAEAR